jgi:hypothetical protein
MIERGKQIKKTLQRLKKLFGPNRNRMLLGPMATFRNKCLMRSPSGIT